MAEPTAAELSQLLQDVRRIEVQSRRLVASVMAGSYRSVFRGAGLEFEEVREYVEGDDPRLIDWAVTARAGRHYVRRYVDERELALLFLFDLSPSMDAGLGAVPARQVAARACACLALSALRNHDKIGLVAFGRRVERFRAPRRGTQHLLRLVRDCLALRPTDGDRDPGTGRGLAEALAFATGAVHRRALLFIVSDWLDPAPERELACAVQRHEVIAVRVNAPELADPGRGLVRVRDPESGAACVVDWSSARVRAAYATRVAEARARTEGILRRLAIDRLDLDVPRVANGDPVARPLLDFFRRRELRGVRRPAPGTPPR